MLLTKNPSVVIMIASCQNSLHQFIEFKVAILAIITPLKQPLRHIIMISKVLLPFSRRCECGEAKAKKLIIIRSTAPYITTSS